jgi:pyruvate dehydrogenase E2 component (dihydrolipoamide acetyltransferase)
MAEVVKMPKMSDTMTEGVLAKWHKKVGDTVKSGDVLAEIETDKATMDFESYQDGTLLYVGVEEGSAVPVDAVIAVLGKAGEDYKALLEGAAAPAKTEEKPAEEAKPATAEDKKPAAAAAPEKAAPAKAKVDTSSIPATVIRMPLLSDTMTEGTIEKWNFKVGDKVKADDSLADVATDKATMEVVGYEAGTLLYIGVKEGEAALVNGIIAIVGKEGTDIQPLLDADSGGEEVAAEAPAGEESKEEAAPAATSDAAPTATSAGSTEDDSRVKASPLARKIAKDKGINLNDVKGSADGGRIIKKDIEGFTPSAKPAETAKPQEGAAAAAPAEKAPVVLPTYTGEEKFTERNVTQMRKAISRRLSESLFTAPHFYVTMAIDMDQAIAARNKMNDVAPVKISFNDFVLKACAVALKQHPAINSSFLGDKIRTNEHVHIGVAVAVDEGLLVPVIKFADGKSLSHISQEVKEFAGKAKAKKLQPAEMEGSTFTISNLGMFGVDEFTAIINTPNACILAVSGIAQVPVVKNGAVVPGNVMKVTLSCDHRVVDGATGAAFLQTLKSLLEEPVRMMI